MDIVQVILETLKIRANGYCVGNSGILKIRYMDIV